MLSATCPSWAASVRSAMYQGWCSHTQAIGDLGRVMIQSKASGTVALIFVEGQRKGSRDPDPGNGVLHHSLPHRCC